MTKREQDLLIAAGEIVSDFRQFGEVLQVGDNGEYGQESSIGRLNNAIGKYEDAEYGCETIK